MQAVTRALSVMCVLAASIGVNAQTPKVITVAGGYLGNGVPAASASLSLSQSVAADAKGDIFVTDGGHCRIRKIDKNGVIAFFAGTGICGYGGDGGPAHLAMISPAGIASDVQGNLLIADSGNQRIRKITKTGIITTIAGNGTAGYSGDDGPATQATLNNPVAVSVDPSGNIYIADSNNVVIRMIDSAGNIHTVAGNGTRGFSGDGGPATSAQFYNPFAVSADGNGNFYVSDPANDRVRKVDSTGTITTYAGNGSFGNSGSGGPATSASIDPSGLLLAGGKLYISTPANIWAVDLSTQLINIVAGTGSEGFDGDGNAALSTLFSRPWGLATDLAGDLLVADFQNDRVRKIDSNQIVTTIAGGYIGDGKPGTQASLDLPQHIAFDPAGNLYIVEYGGNRVRKLSTAGEITTFAGTGITGYSGDGGKASAATLNAPNAVAADSSGNIFIADSGNAVIRKVDTLGTITTFASNIYAFAIATDAAGNVYASDAHLVWKITPAGSSSIIAGNQNCYGYGGDGGPATQACLLLPYGVAVDAAGNVYIMDTSNFRIRKVNTSGIISTIAGNGIPGYSGDGGPATAASLSGFSLDVAVDSKGNIYIADSVNARVRIVDASGTIRTYAGTGNSSYNGNSLPATQTNMYPLGLAINAKGVVYVSDGNERVRKIH